MKRTYVSFDLETTGLDPEKDRIVEIGAVKFCEGKVVDTFQTFVNPQRPLPSRVRWLTGINDDDLCGAPLFSDVAGAFREFAGDCPLVGQNAEFDVTFLANNGVTLPGEVFDTLEMATILYPTLPEYSLGALAARFHIDVEAAHRAYHDALATKDLFLTLLERAGTLPLSLLAEINRITMGSNWPWRRVLLDMEASKSGGLSLWDGAPRWDPDIAPSPVEDRPASREGRSRKPLDVDELAGLFGQGGPLSGASGEFDFGVGAMRMLRNVATTFNTGGSLLVEAGIGTPGPLAYLLPALDFAAGNGCPVLVSPGSFNQEEQLLGRDIPWLLERLGPRIVAPEVVRLKGRAKYVCLRRWNTLRQVPRLSWDEARFLVRLLIWLDLAGKGDASDLSLTYADYPHWGKLRASEENCAGKRCPHWHGRCFFLQARRKAEQSHLVIMDHSALLADIVRGCEATGDYRHVVIDEAHRLEDETTRELSYSAGAEDAVLLLGSLAEGGGLMNHVRTYADGYAASAAEKRSLSEYAERLAEETAMAGRSSSALFEALGSFLVRRAGEPVNFDVTVRLTTEVRSHPAWSEVLGLWSRAATSLVGLENRLGMLDGLLDENSEDADAAGALAEAWVLRRQVKDLRESLDTMLVKTEDGWIYWAACSPNRMSTLHAAPLRVDGFLQENLFSKKECTVLTGSTLSVGGSLSYLRKSVGLNGAAELSVESPFDFAKAALLYLPSDMPEPDAEGYQEAIRQSLIGLAGAMSGRTMALFTSHNALRAAYGVVEPVLEKQGMLLFGQGIDGSIRKVMNLFKSTPQSVLFGASTMWDGFEAIGDALKVLVIVRLPFSVPVDPVIASRCEQFSDPFSEYLVPQAVLKFKRGFSRLFNSRTDRGAVVVLDRRLQTKAYGKVFLDSLPGCAVKRGPLGRMPGYIKDWVGD